MRVFTNLFPNILVVLVAALCACSGEEGNGDGGELFKPTSAYFSPDRENPERSLLPSPNVLALNTSTTPPTLNIKASICHVPGSATEASLQALEGLNGFGTFVAGGIQAFFGRELESASLSDRLVMVDLGTFGGDGSDADLSHPLPLATVLTRTARYLNGCEAEPSMVPTLVAQPFDKTTGLPVVLQGNHQYALALLNGVQDVNGDEVVPFYVWSMVRATDTVEVPDLVPVQDAYRPVLDAFEAIGHARGEILVAWTFNTQFIAPALLRIASRLGTLGLAYDDTSVTVPAATLPIPPLPADQFLDAMGLDCTQIGAPGCPGLDTLLSGEFLSPDFQEQIPIPAPYLPVDAGPTTIPGSFSDTLQPAVQGSAGKKISFLASTPAGVPGPYPVVIFQHPLTPTDPADAAKVNKLAVLGLANTLGQAGMATVAIDGVLAGDRAVLVVNGTNGTTQLFPFIHTDVMATRDNIRQTTVDLMQLVRVLKACTAETCGGLHIDPARIHFVGTSAGSIVGSLFVALSPDVKRAVLNAPAAGLSEILATSPVLSAQLAPLLCLGGVISSSCCSRTPPTCSPEDLASDPGFAGFKMMAQWMIDPADPANHISALAEAISAGKRILVQEATGDKVFPNTGSALLAGLLGFAAGSDGYRSYDPGACGQVPGGAHAMLLQNCGAGTLSMQTDIVSFLLAP